MFQDLAFHGPKLLALAGRGLAWSWLSCTELSPDKSGSSPNVSQDSFAPAAIAFLLQDYAEQDLRDFRGVWMLYGTKDGLWFASSRLQDCDSSCLLTCLQSTSLLWKADVKTTCLLLIHWKEVHSQWLADCCRGSVSTSSLAADEMHVNSAELACIFERYACQWLQPALRFYSQQRCVSWSAWPVYRRYP